MKEERLEILRMIREGVVTVEEGERLLRALEEGEDKEKSKTGKKSGFSVFFNETLGDMFSSLGGMIKSTVEAAVGSTVVIDSDMERMDITDNRFALPEGAALKVVIKSKGDLHVGASQDGDCLLMDPVPEDVKLYGKEGEFVLLCKSGDLHLAVPVHLERFSLITYGGNIAVREVPVRLKAKTMGGDIVLTKPAKPFSVKTMGGNMELRLDQPMAEDCKALTMGGNILLAVKPDIRFVLSAKTMGGTIDIDEALPAAGQKVQKGVAWEKLHTQFTGDNDPFTLAMKTMGGDIVIKATAARADHD